MKFNRTFSKGMILFSIFYLVLTVLLIVYVNWTIIEVSKALDNTKLGNTVEEWFTVEDDTLKVSDKPCQ